MPTRTQTRELRWPSLGIVRRQAHERVTRETEYSCPWSTNVYLTDTLTKRLRGGSRPGLTDWSGTSDSTLAGSTVGHLLPITFLSGSTVTSSLMLGANTCSLVARGPRVYSVASAAITILDPVAGDTTTMVASSGTVPTGCTVGCVYRDRLVIGGANNAIYLSRQGDLTDWDYSGDLEDLRRALPIQLSEAGEIGGVATALLPYRDEMMLAATANTLWRIQGDPTTGGLKNISRGVGIAGKRTWCEVKDAQVGDVIEGHGYVFLSSLGLFKVSPTGDGLERLSEETIPDELLDIPSTSTVSMAYSPEDRGIWIFVTPSSGAGTHWFFDLVKKAFWPMVFGDNDHQPLAATWYDGKLIVYCQDESLRYIAGDDDDGTTLTSYVLLGPVRLSGPDRFGRLTAIRGMIAANSGTVLWKIITGDTAEEACANGKSAITEYLDGDTQSGDAYVHTSGSWSAGRSSTSYPRTRAMWICVLLTSSAQWAYESITIQSRDSGNWR